jgi:hypothetical protein
MSPKSMEIVKYFENGLWEFLEMYRLAKVDVSALLKEKERR